MRRFFANKWVIVALAALLLVVFIIFGLIPNSPIDKLLTPVRVVVNPIQGFIKTCGTKLDDYWAAITDGVAIRQKNVELSEEIARLQYEANKNEEAIIRYEELKEAFHIKDTFSNYDIHGASVLSREADEWFSVIRIGAGKDDGLELTGNNSYAVIDTKSYLIGRVIETNANDSKILPLTHEGFTVVGKVNEVNGAILVISGDAALKNNNLCLVTGIDEDVDLEIGTEIVTSGDGGLFPQGIPIGTIESVDDSDPLNITATLKPYASIDDLKDVFIMIPLNEPTDGSAEAAESEVSDEKS